MLRIIVIALVMLSLPSLAQAQFKNENLMVTMPDGYKVGFEDKKNNQIMTEMVPSGEIVKNWTEMLTVQVFLGMKDTPEGYKQRFEKMWADACAGAESSPVAQAVERGYPMTVWIQWCPLNKATGKPELTMLKAIQGNDSFYLVQKAFKFKPNKEQVEHWSRYLRSVYVCDMRVADRSCPSTKP